MVTRRFDLRPDCVQYKRVAGTARTRGFAGQVLGTRANLSPEGRKLANQRYVLFPITLEQFTPLGTDKDQVVPTMHAPPLTLDVEIGTDPFDEDNVAQQLLESSVEGGTRQSEVEHIESSLKKIRRHRRQGWRSQDRQRNRGFGAA